MASQLLKALERGLIASSDTPVSPTLAVQQVFVEPVQCTRHQGYSSEPTDKCPVVKELNFPTGRRVSVSE